jgi:hypothetical protein
VLRQVLVQRFHDRFTELEVDVRDLKDGDLKAYLSDPYQHNLTPDELQELLGEYQRRTSGKTTEKPERGFGEKKDNRRKLAKLTGVKQPWFQAPVRRHLIASVTLEDVKGHSVYTTVTAGDVEGDVRRINDGDFTECWSTDNAIRIKLDDKVYGCTLHREDDKLMLYPVRGPFCTSLTHSQLEALVRIRDLPSAENPAQTAALIKRWYSKDILTKAIGALEWVGWNAHFAKSVLGLQ